MFAQIAAGSEHGTFQLTGRNATATGTGASPATELALTSMVIPKSKLCVGLLQSGRMKNDHGFMKQLDVFDTDIRQHVRRELRKQIFEDEKNIFVTGPGGTGKSFNLARFVMELRDEGHVVAYVPTMDNVVNDPMNLLDELKHAVATAKLKDFAVTIPSKRRYNLILQVPQLQMVEDAFSACNVACTKQNKRLVLVIDQDNRLWKKISYSSVYQTLDDAICTLPCQLVLCASANNEGWERRTWAQRIYHGIDKVPLPLLTSMGASPSEVEFLERNFGLYPLDTLVALQMATKQGADPQLRAEALVMYRQFRASAIETGHSGYLEEFPEAWKGAFHEATIGSGRYNQRFDRRFLTDNGETNEPLRALHPVALSALIESAEKHALGRETSRLALAKIVVDSAKAGPYGFFYELMFEKAAGGLFNPAASAAYREFVVEKSLYDVPAKAVIDTFRHMSPPAAKKLVKLPARSQAVDFYLLEKFGDDETKVRAIAIQVTVNPERAATHEVFVRKVRNFLTPPSTMYEQLKKSGVDSISFLYVTDSPTGLGVGSWTKLPKASEYGNVALTKSKSISMLLKNNVDVCTARVSVSPEATLNAYRAVISKDLLRTEFYRTIVEENSVIKKTQQLVAPTFNTDATL
jgi:hypothetical protein